MTINTANNYLSTVYLEFLFKKELIKNFDDLSIDLSDENWKNIFSSQISFNNKDYSKSKEFASKIIQNPDINDNILLAEAYNILGRIARLYKLDSDAKAFYDSALTNFKKNNTFFSEFGCVRLEFNQANILLLNSELSKAIKAYTELLEKIEKLKPMDELKSEFDRLKLKIYQNQALTFLYQAKTDDSKNRFEKALTLIPSIEGSSTEADFYVNYSNLAIIQENFELAYELLSKASVLYKKLDRIDFFSKIEIDKIKINLLSDIDKSIDPLLASNLITYYEQAKKNKEVNLKVVEIFELLYSQGKVNEASELRNFLLSQDFLPDLRGRILYIAMGLYLFEKNYDEVYKLSTESIDIVKQLNDEDSLLPIEVLLDKTKFLQKGDFPSLLKGLKNNTNKLLKMKDTRTAITIYEEYFTILFDQRNYAGIIDILTQVEEVVFKKVKDREVKEFHENDLILIFALLKDPRAKSLLKSSKKSFANIKDTSRFNSKLDQNPEIEQEIKEFLSIA